MVPTRAQHFTLRTPIPASMQHHGATFNARYIFTSRISKSTFKTLCGRLRGHFQQQDTHFRKCIPLAKRVAMCIYALSSSAELRMVANLFGVGKSTLCKALHEFCNEINLTVMPELIVYPTSPHTIQVLIDGFMSDWQFPQAFGALDGCHIKVCPPKEYVVDYFCYKQFYSTVLLAMCDSAYRFIYINVGSPGRNNDARVFHSSSLPLLMSDNTVLNQLTHEIEGVEIPPVILADSAFPLLPNLMKPFPDGPTTTDQEWQFNYHLSRARRVIDNSFGRLKARFRVLRKPMSRPLYKPAVHFTIFMKCWVMPARTNGWCQMRT